MIFYFVDILSNFASRALYTATKLQQIFQICKFYSKKYSKKCNFFLYRCKRGTIDKKICIKNNQTPHMRRLIELQLAVQIIAAIPFCHFG